jgi:hypothetical protein
MSEHFLPMAASALPSMNATVPTIPKRMRVSSRLDGPRLRQCATVLLLSIALSPASGFVYQTESEFTSAGDFDGDGRADVVVVDKATGNFRIGYQLTAGQHTWAKARGSGIEAVGGFSAGKLLNAGRDALAFTAPDANRINVLEAATPGAPALPGSVFLPAVGPNLVVALDIGGAGNTALEDLFIGSVDNAGSFPDQLNLLRNNAGSFSSLAGDMLTAPLGGGNVVVLKSGTPKIVAALLRGGASDTFRAYNLSAGTVAQAVQLTGLATNSAYVYANFSASAFAQFLFYQPGELNGVVRLRSVTEPSPGTFGFAAEVPFTFGAPIQQIFTLPNGSTTRLLIVFGDGESAGIYNFDGVNPPVPVQQLDAPAGESFSGAVPFGNGSFMMLSSLAGSKTSSHFQSYNLSGANYVAAQGGNLPAVTALSASANLFQFEAEPFVSATPNLLRTLSAGDWTSQFNKAALPQLSVMVESFASPSNGLDNPAPMNLGSANPLTHFGLVNQYVAPLSLFSLTRPVGDEVADVKISPPAGLYKAGVKFSFTVAPAGTLVFYRLNSGNWIQFNGVPVPVFAETTVSFYAKGANNAKSAIHHATYKFSVGPGTLDSDSDGVPDFVEIAKGLDPKKGADSDGDGYSDLDELLHGTNPSDPSSVPSGPRLELKSGFDLIQAPRPLDGTVNALTTSRTNTAVRAYELSGGLLAYGVTANLNLPVVNPAAMLSNIVIDAKQRLLAVATEQHFDINTASADTKIGRELLGLFAVPNVAYKLDVPFNYQGGNITNAANAWIAAAQAAQATITRETVRGELDMFDTLAALLVEKKVSEELGARGLASASNLTLFPFRPTDNGRDSLGQATLLALETQGANGEPAYLLWNLYCAVTNAVAVPTPLNAGPRGVTSEIYRISSLSNNAAPGKYPSPVDTLRDFLSTGVLHSNYLAETTMTAGDLANAYAAAGQLLAAIRPRPTTNATLQVRADTFTGHCTLLDTVPPAATKALLFANGQPYRLLENFDLPAGSQVHVFGYTDVSSADCAGEALEVIALGLDSVPAISALDTDGDLLPDDWEMLMFGHLARGGSDDSDGDGINNLQEFFDHTDPKDGLSKSAIAFNLAPPQIDLSPLVGNQLKLTWSWPDAYANKVKFNLQMTDDLGQSFTPTFGAPQNLGGGQFQLVLPNPGAGVRFYRLLLSNR